MDASKHDRKAGTAVFVQKGSTLKVMEEFNIQGKQTSFTNTVLELLDTPLYSGNCFIFGFCLSCC